MALSQQGKKKAKKLMKPATYMQQKKEGMKKERKVVVASEKSVKEVYIEQNTSSITIKFVCLSSCIQLLGELYCDREYLDKLMKDPSKDYWFPEFLSLYAVEKKNQIHFAKNALKYFQVC